MDHSDFGNHQMLAAEPAASRPTLIRQSAPYPAQNQRQCRCRKAGLPWLSFAVLALLLAGRHHHHAAAWHIPAPPAAPRVSVADTPVMIGTWVGRFGEESCPALLVIDSQDGSNFDGVLIDNSQYGVCRVRVRGTITSGSQIALNETDVLQTPWFVTWLRGHDVGSLSADGLSAEGTGSDAIHSYNWNFSHASSTASEPAG